MSIDQNHWSTHEGAIRAQQRADGVLSWLSVCVTIVFNYKVMVVANVSQLVFLWKKRYLPQLSTFTIHRKYLVGEIFGELYKEKFGK